MAPKAPHFARAQPIDTLDEAVGTDDRIELRADYRTLETTWLDGGLKPADAATGGGYEVLIDGVRVDLGPSSAGWTHTDGPKPWRSSTVVDVPRGKGDALITIERDGEVLSRLTIDRLGGLKRGQWTSPWRTEARQRPRPARRWASRWTLWRRPFKQSRL